MRTAFGIAWSVGLVAVTSCSSPNPSSDGLGDGEQSLTAAPDPSGEPVPVDPSAKNQNFSVLAGARRRETAVAHADHGQGTWIVAYNTNLSLQREAGWAYSDGDETHWVPNVIASKLAWGDPGPNPHDGSPFGGWRGDPTVSAVEDPALSNGGRRILYGNIANDGVGVVVAVSDDSGHTFDHAQYVDTAATGTGIDRPWIATHTSSPYSTYVSWTDSTGVWINKIAYEGDCSVGSSSCSFVRGSPVPIAAGPNYVWPRIAIGNINTSSSASLCETGEVIFIVTTNGAQRCTSRTYPSETVNIEWSLFLYVPSSGHKYGPFPIDADPTFPICVGGQSPQWTNLLQTNNPTPVLAVNPDSTDWYITHTRSTSSKGTRTVVNHGKLFCGGDIGLFPFPSGTWIAPDPPPRPDSSPAFNDEWGPAVALIPARRVPNPNGLKECLEAPCRGAPGPFSGPHPLKIVVSWYDTRDDPVQNTLTRIYGGQAIAAHTFSDSVFPIAFATFESLEQVPWQPANWDDYHSIGVDISHGQFLDAWGGDNRKGDGGDIFVDLIQ